MKASTLVMSLITASGLALAATIAMAHPGGGWGPGNGGYGPGMGMMGQGAGPFGGGNCGGTPLFTPEERAALQERMRATTTVEERQRLMLEHRTEMQRRAAERGITPCQGPNAGKDAAPK